MISGSRKIILASSSPRRKALLEQVGLRFEIRPAEVDEQIRDGESPIAYVLRIAEQKALNVAGNAKGSWIIGADTIVYLDGEIFGKPVGKEAAHRMLQKLSGREHTVITGFCIYASDTEESIKDYNQTNVMLKQLTDAEIEGYVNTGEPFDKAGGYAIQGIGSFMVKAINGSYTNVVGLPVCEVVAALQHAGAISFEISYPCACKDSSRGE